MKSLRAILMLSGALGVFGVTAGCTPSESFCPNVGADAGGVCPNFGDDAIAPVEDMGGTPPTCPPGYQLETNPDGNAGLVCVKTS